MDKIKKFYDDYKKYIFLLGGGIVLIIVIAFSFSSGKDYVTGIIDNMVKKQTAMIMQDYEKRLAQVEKNIKESQEKIIINDKNLAKLKKQREDIKNEIKNVKEPKDTKELYDTFNSLGFTVLQ